METKGDRMLKSFLLTLEAKIGKQKVEEELKKTKDCVMNVMKIKQIKKLFHLLSFIQKVKFIIKYPIILLPYK